MGHNHRPIARQGLKIKVIGYGQRSASNIRQHECTRLCSFELRLVFVVTRSVRPRSTAEMFSSYLMLVPACIAIIVVPGVDVGGVGRRASWANDRL